MTSTLLRVVEGQISNRERTRTNETHLAGKNVHELRQLIEAGSSEPTADGSNPIGIGEEVPVGPFGSGHGAEFANPKDLASAARPLMPEEQWWPLRRQKRC